MYTCIIKIFIGPACNLIAIILSLGDINEKLGGENIFKPIIWNESLRQDSNDDVVRLVNFAVSKNLAVKSTMFPHRDIHK